MIYFEPCWNFFEYRERCPLRLSCEWIVCVLKGVNCLLHDWRVKALCDYTECIVLYVYINV